MFVTLFIFIFKTLKTHRHDFLKQWTVYLKFFDDRFEMLIKRTFFAEYFSYVKLQDGNMKT